MKSMACAKAPSRSCTLFCWCCWCCDNSTSLTPPQSDLPLSGKREAPQADGGSACHHASRAEASPSGGAVTAPRDYWFRFGKANERRNHHWWHRIGTANKRPHHRQWQHQRQQPAGIIAARCTYLWRFSCCVLCDRYTRYLPEVVLWGYGGGGWKVNALCLGYPPQ